MPSLSVERWLALATAGDSRARFHLGKIFSCGLGVHKDYKQAIYWFQLAAEQGHDDAQFSLGWAYHLGLGGYKDAQKASEWYQKAAEQGHAEAQFQLGRLYTFSDLRNDALAVEWFLCAAKQDHSSAQFKLGWMYHLGMGVEQSDRQAFHWFILAAEQDHAGAQASLGEMYKHGWGSSKMMLLRRIGFIVPEQCTIPKPALCGFLHLRVRGLRSWLLPIHNRDVMVNPKRSL